MKRSDRIVGLDTGLKAPVRILDSVPYRPFATVEPIEVVADGSPRLHAWRRWLQGPGVSDPPPAPVRAWREARARSVKQTPLRERCPESVNVGVIMTVTGWGELEQGAVRAAWVRLRPATASRMVVVQNSPSHWERTEVWCSEFSGIQVVAIDNYGFAHANNRGASLLDAHPWLLFTQADVKWTLEALDDALAIAESWGNATVGPGGGQVSGDKRGNVFEVGRNVGHPGLWPGKELATIRADWIAGYWFLCPRKCFDVVGGWSEFFFLYSEDPDLSMRLEIAGSPQVVSPTLDVDHQRGTTISAAFSDTVRGAIQDHSRRRFNQRWGGL